jgi:GMP synthase-like glutamine amidotransferase
VSLQDAVLPSQSISDAPRQERMGGQGIRRRWFLPRRAAHADVIILQHHDNASPGLLLDVLGARRVAWRVTRVDRAERLPDPPRVALAVVLGCDEPAADTRHQWISTKLEWLRAADRAGTTILGLGSGAQALAVALGGGVERADTSAPGWREVTTAEPKTITPGPWFSWREDLIRLPAGGQILAHNERGPQAYRADSHLGVQFHPEVTPKIITQWVYGEHGHVLDTQGVMEATSREFKAATVAARHLLSTFVGSVQRLNR